MRIGIVVTMVLSFVGEVALADGFSSRNRKSLFSSQTRILDTRALKQYSRSVRLKPVVVTHRQNGVMVHLLALMESTKANSFHWHVKRHVAMVFLKICSCV